MRGAAARVRPRRPARPLPWLGPGIVVGGLLPIVVLALDFRSGALGANPVQNALLQTGVLTLALLTISLACTPLRKLTGWAWPARIRKALGLLAGLYAALHFSVYLYDQGFSWSTVLADVAKRPFITSGFTALLLLIPLALTSTPRSVRRLGFQRWTMLHQLVYAAISLGLLHYWWGVKKDHSTPLAYALVVAALFALRFLPQRRKRRAAKPERAQPGPEQPLTGDA